MSGIQWLFPWVVLIIEISYSNVSVSSGYQNSSTWPHHADIFDDAQKHNTEIFVITQSMTWYLPFFVTTLGVSVVNGHWLLVCTFFSRAKKFKKQKNRHWKKKQKNKTKKTTNYKNWWRKKNLLNKYRGACS